MMGRIGTALNSAFSLLRMPAISFGIVDVVEILILAYLVYNFLAWIKNTRAFTLLRGILVIAVAVAIVYLLQMDTLIYLLNRFISIAIITAVVVFQPELRKVLEQLGERQMFLFRMLPTDANRTVQERFSDKTVNELVRASTEMGREKTGALIVLEQNETLYEYERTGISIDAQVSSQLLINIFEHNTPLHDGAVIIRGDRITAATCYLPLSDNRSLSKELGTRHRAGVGISEVTDSLTIIVSEETGQISTAYKGVLERDLSSGELKEKLTKFQNKSVVNRKFHIRRGRSKSNE